jgi:hypothetical protein
MNVNFMMTLKKKIWFKVKGKRDSHSKIKMIKWILIIDQHIVMMKINSTRAQTHKH